MNIGDEVRIGWSTHRWTIAGFALGGPLSTNRGKRKAVLVRQFSDNGGLVKTRWPESGLRKVGK